MDKGCWVEKKVREFDSVVSEAKKTTKRFTSQMFLGAELKQGDS